MLRNLLRADSSIHIQVLIGQRLHEALHGAHGAAELSEQAGPLALLALAAVHAERIHDDFVQCLAYSHTVIFMANTLSFDDEPVYVSAILHIGR